VIAEHPQERGVAGDVLQLMVFAIDVDFCNGTQPSKAVTKCSRFQFRNMISADRASLESPLRTIEKVWVDRVGRHRRTVFRKQACGCGILLRRVDVGHLFG